MSFVAALSAPQIEPTKAGTPSPDVPATFFDDPDNYEDATEVYGDGTVTVFDDCEFIARASTAARDIALSNIARKSEYIRADAESIARYMRAIDGLPIFETQAEDTIERAELALTETLLAVKLARSELQRKRRPARLVAAE